VLFRSPLLFAACGAGVAFCAANALWALARLENSWTRRLREIWPGLVVGLILVAAIRLGYTRVAVGRYDLDRTLAFAAGVKHHVLPPRAIMTITGAEQPIYAGIAARHTLANLADDEATRRAVRALVARRGCRTVLATDACQHLQECAFLDWDLTAAAREALEAAQRAPTVRMQFALLALLGAGSASPENVAMVQALCDRSKFVSTTPQAQLRLGGLLWRYGRKEAALGQWRLAGMSKEAWEALARQPPPFVAGQVAGRVKWNGQPAAGLRVGLAPIWAAQDLAGPLRPADQAMIAPATTTDAAGKFALKNVVEGQYALALALDELRFERGQALSSVGVDFPFIKVSRDRPDVGLGTINVTVAARSEPPPAPARRGP
jgi:hypothetical protein